MELSQNRTREVLKYVLSAYLLNEQDRLWTRKFLTANGLSSSKLVIENQIENKQKSRRVEFRVKTNAETRIVKILGTTNL